MSAALKQRHPSCERISEEDRKSPAAVHPNYSDVVKKSPETKGHRRVGAMILINSNAKK